MAGRRRAQSSCRWGRGSEMDIQIRVLASSSRGNCYAITDGRTKLLIECGIRFRDIQRALGFRISGLAGCLLSHEHEDHARAVRELMRAGVDIYASRGTIDALGMSGHRLRSVQAHKPFTVGTWTVLPFDTVHDAAEPLGFLLASPAGKVLYLTDTAYCRYRFKGLTHVMVEANYSTELIHQNVAAGVIPLALKNRILRNHMSLERALDLLRANDLRQVREIWLLHLSDQNSDAELFRRQVQEVTGKPVYVAESMTAKADR